MASGSSEETSYFSTEMAREWLPVFTISLLASYLPSGFDCGQVCLLPHGQRSAFAGRKHELVWANSAAWLGLALSTSQAEHTF